jgi:hypothetical protein
MFPDTAEGDLAFIAWTRRATLWELTEVGRFTARQWKRVAIVRAICHKERKLIHL